MTREDIIRMAREAGLHAPEGRTYILSPTIHPDDDLSEYLERFAALVASAERDRLTDFAIQAAEKAVDMAIALEREACARVCSEMYLEGDMDTGIAAEAIRARGQA